MLRVVISVLTCIGMVSGCAQTISGIPTTQGAYSTTRVAGLPAANGPSGPKTDAPNTPIPVDGTDNGETDKLARNAVADVESYWAQAFPETFSGKKFDPLKRLVSYDSNAPGAPLCGQNTAHLANAFYCPTEDSIAWDRGALLPELEHNFGPMAVVTVLAHEMGHAVQNRAGIVKPGDPVIVLEQQADCFTGAYFHHVAAGDSPFFRVSTGTGLNQVMSVLSYIRDTPDVSNFTGTSAHGTAFDRISAFQDGFSDGPERCAKMNFDDVAKRTTLFQNWKPAQNEPELPVDDKSIAAVSDSLHEVFRDTGAAEPRITTTPMPCAGHRRTTPADYCPATNTISLDMNALRAIAQPPSTTNESTGYGDFAAFAQIASRYALSVQQAAGYSLDDEMAGLRTACMVGAWSGLLVEDPIGHRNPVGKLRVLPDDIDEGVSALLGDNSLIAANVNGQQVPVGFARLEAFRLGVQEGLTPCTTKYGS